MSDPTINGALPAKQFRLNEQTTWSVGYYTAGVGNGPPPSAPITTWSILAGLGN